MSTENGIFTRIEGSRWVIAMPSADVANTRVLVDRKGRPEPVKMAVGEYLRPMEKRAGWHLYAIDRERGGKAPTAGNMGKNAESGESTMISAGGHQTISQTYTPAEQPAIDLSEYVTRPELGTAIAEVSHALGQQIEAAQPRIIEINAHPGAPIRRLEGTHHKVLPDVLACLAAGVHVYLVGPAGSGKTHLAESCEAALERTLYTVGAMLTKHEVTGYQDANGRYVTTAAREAYEHGGILLWDEVDASLPAALVAVNAMLSNSQYTFPDRTVQRHPDFVVIAAGNTYGTGSDREYVGRMQLDAATLDRFAFIEVEYDLALERALACAEYLAHGGESEGDLDRWVDTVQDTRKLIQERGVRHVVSPRASIYGAKLLARGMKRASVIQLVLVKGIAADVAAQLGLAEVA